MVYELALKTNSEKSCRSILSYDNIVETNVCNFLASLKGSLLAYVSSDPGGTFPPPRTPETGGNSAGQPFCLVKAG